MPHGQETVSRLIIEFEKWDWYHNRSINLYVINDKGENIMKQNKYKVILRNSIGGLAVTCLLSACNGTVNSSNSSSVHSVNTSSKQVNLIQNPEHNYVYIADQNNRILTYKISTESTMAGHLTELKQSISGGLNVYKIKLAPSGHFIYAIDIAGKTINMFHRSESTGLLSPLTPASVPTGPWSVDMTFDPSGRYAYVINTQDGSISIYNVESTTGELTLITTTPPTYLEAQSIKFGPTNGDNITRAYVTNDNIPGSLSIYNFDPANGLLTLEYSPQISLNDPSIFTFDPSGKYLYIGSLDSSKDIYMYSLEESSGLPNPLNPNKIMATEFLSDFSFGHFKKYLYATDIDSEQVLMYSYNESTGLLQALSPHTAPAGIFSVGITFDQSGKYAYVANGNDKTVSTYIVESNGILTPSRYIPEKIVTNRSPQQVVFSQNDSFYPIIKYAYTVDYDSNAISMYKKNGNGVLTPLKTSSIATGSGPKSIMIDRSKSYVYVANELSDNISMYKIIPQAQQSESAGELIPLATVHSGGTRPTVIKGDPTSNLVYVLNTESNNIAIFKPGTGVDAGKLSRLRQISTGLKAPADITWRTVKSGTYTSIYAYVSNKGSDTIAVFQLVRDDLVYLGSYATGGGPTGIITGLNGTQSKYIYVINSASDSISEYQVESNGWSLALIGTIASNGDAPSGIEFAMRNDTTQSYVYVTNYVSDSIAMYSVSPTTGLLTEIASPISTHKSPNKLVFDASPPFAIYVANTGESMISAYNMESDGLLTPLHPFSDIIDGSPVAITSY